MYDVSMEITVTDTSKDIPQDKHEKVFGNYTKLDDYSKK